MLDAWSISIGPIDIDKQSEGGSPIQEQFHKFH